MEPNINHTKTVIPVKLRRMRRILAVSTIIANVMIATLVLTLGVLTFIWGSGQFLSFQGTSNIFFVARGEAVRERLIVEDVWFNPSGTTKNLTFFVRNVGKLEVTVVSVFVFNSTSTSSTVSKQFSLSGKNVVLVGVLLRFSVKCPSSDPAVVCVSDVGPDFQSGATYTVIVTTTRGTRAVTQWRFP